MKKTLLISALTFLLLSSIVFARSFSGMVIYESPIDAMSLIRQLAKITGFATTTESMMLPDSAYHSHSNVVSKNQDANDNVYLDLDYSPSATQHSYNEWIRYDISSLGDSLKAIELEFNGAYSCYAGYCEETCVASKAQAGCRILFDNDMDHGIEVIYDNMGDYTFTQVSGTPTDCGIPAANRDLHSSGSVYETAKIEYNIPIDTSVYKYIEFMRGGGGSARGDCYIDYVKLYFETEETTTTTMPPTTTIPGCTDSDGGADYEVKGTCIDSVVKVESTDYCSSSNEKLAEYQCKSFQGKEYCVAWSSTCEEFVGAGYVCEDGKCVKGEIPLKTFDIEIWTDKTKYEPGDFVEVYVDSEIKFGDCELYLKSPDDHKTSVGSGGCDGNTDTWSFRFDSADYLNKYGVWTASVVMLKDGYENATDEHTFDYAEASNESPDNTTTTSSSSTTTTTTLPTGPRIVSFGCESISGLKAQCGLGFEDLEEDKKYFVYVAGSKKDGNDPAVGATTISGSDESTTVVVLSLREDIYRLGAWLFEGSEPDVIKSSLHFWDGFIDVDIDQQ